MISKIPLVIKDTSRKVYFSISGFYLLLIYILQWMIWDMRPLSVKEFH